MFLYCGLTATTSQINRAPYKQCRRGHPSLNPTLIDSLDCFALNPHRSSEIGHMFRHRHRNIIIRQRFDNLPAKQGSLWLVGACLSTAQAPSPSSIPLLLPLQLITNPLCWSCIPASSAMTISLGIIPIAWVT